MSDIPGVRMREPDRADCVTVMVTGEEVLPRPGPAPTVPEGVIVVVGGVVTTGSAAPTAPLQ
jgi:hypothetical protein